MWSLSVVPLTINRNHKNIQLLGLLWRFLKSTNIKCLAPCLVHVMVSIIMLLSITIKLPYRSQALVQWAFHVTCCHRMPGSLGPPLSPKCDSISCLPFQKILFVLWKWSLCWVLVMCEFKMVVTPGVISLPICQGKGQIRLQLLCVLGPQIVN